MRQVLGMFCLLAAYALLIPGITEPVLHIISTLDKTELAKLATEAMMNSAEIPVFLTTIAEQLLDQIDVSGKIVIQESQKSLLGTAEGLWQEGNILVAFLIIFFSIIIPALKGLLLVAAYLLKHFSWVVSVEKMGSYLSKWSMVDVFVMALLVSFLAIKASANQSALIEIEIQFEVGFYYFLGYCLLSILSSQLLVSSKVVTKNP